MKTSLLFQVLILCLFFSTSSSAQTLVKDSVYLSVLVLENLDKRETKLLSEGAGVRYQLKNDKRKMKGKIELIKDNSMVISGTEIKFEDIQTLSGKVRSDRQLGGGILIGLGATTSVFGGVLIGSVPGLGVAVGGLAALGTGIHLVTSYKKFKTYEGWRIHSGKIAFDRGR